MNHQLLEAARGGSSDALGMALEACRAYLTLIAEREIDSKLRAKGSPSDIVQDTFIEAQRAFPRFSSSSQAEFLTWLRVLLLNNISDLRRKYYGTAMRAAHRETSIDASRSSSDWRDYLAAPIATPSGEFVQQETMDELKEAIARLPDDYQLIILYRYVDELSFQEIADLMGKSPNAIQKLFARAIRKLQQHWEPSP